MSDFLPQGYEKPASNSNYMKFEQGENKFRILSNAITGWIDWKETTEGKKPVRTVEKMADINPKRPAKHFWTFVVWDYREKRVKILEISQSTIQDTIYGLHMSEDWGDPKGYNLVVNRTGEKMETKYQVIPAPHSELSQSIRDEYGKMRIDLEKLYKNEDPFIQEDGRDNAPAYPDQRLDDQPEEKNPMDEIQF